MVIESGKSKRSCENERNKERKRKTKKKIQKCSLEHGERGQSKRRLREREREKGGNT